MCRCRCLCLCGATSIAHFSEFLPDREKFPSHHWSYRLHLWAVKCQFENVDTLVLRTQGGTSHSHPDWRPVSLFMSFNLQSFYYYQAASFEYIHIFRSTCVHLKRRHKNSDCICYFATCFSYFFAIKKANNNNNNHEWLQFAASCCIYFEKLYYRILLLVKFGRQAFAKTDFCTEFYLSVLMENLKCFILKNLVVLSCASHVLQNNSNNNNWRFSSTSANYPR